jgi:S1-C subfamily serine protease
VAGETLTWRVRSGGDVREVELAAVAAAARPASPALGLTLRRQVGIGAEVVRVDRASAADRAGLAVGDVITLFAGVAAPTPDQVMRTFTSVRAGQRVLIAVTRGEVHHVMTLER